MIIEYNNNSFTSHLLVKINLQYKLSGRYVPSVIPCEAKKITNCFSAIVPKSKEGFKETSHEIMLL